MRLPVLKQMRTTGPYSARFHFSSCTFFANNFAHSIFAMLAIADGVANSRFIGCLVALFFPSSFAARYNATPLTKTNTDNRTLPFPVNGNPSARFRKRNVTDVGKPTRTRPEARTKTKGEAEPLLLFWCGQQDLNLHEKCLIRSLVLCVCQFRHVRFLIPIKPRLPRNLTDIARL